MSKPGIPSVPPSLPQVYNFLEAVKTNIELLTGVRGGTIEVLSPDATLADVIAKVNEVIARLNVK